jgi:hypothetical protein
MGDVEVVCIGISEMGTAVGIEREADSVCRNAQISRQLLAQRHPHRRKTQRVFVAAKALGSCAFFVTEWREGGVVQ